jgi:hypothetical protein
VFHDSVKIRTSGGVELGVCTDLRAARRPMKYCKLTVDAPSDVWSDELREEIRANKVEIANALEADELTFHLEVSLVISSNSRLAQRITTK